VKSIAVEVDSEQREQRGPWHVGFNTVHGELADRTNNLASVDEAYLRREKNRIEEIGYELEGLDRVDPYTEWTLRG
jgi:hypothetical protein